MGVKAKIKGFFRKPQNIILFILLIALVYLTLVPLLSIIVDTFTVHTSEVMRIPGSVAGDRTLYHWKMVFFDKGSLKLMYKPLLNSLVCSIGPCIVSIVLGGAFAWLITRTDIRMKKLLSSLAIFPYIMPSWTLALAWNNVFKNSLVGGSPGLFTSITGLETPNWFAYGPFPIIIVTGIHYAPFAYILIGGILRNMDANLEEAALILKTSRSKILWKITFPMIMPAILSTFLLVFSSSMSSFAVPSFLGLPVKYQVLTTQLYRTLNGLNPGYGYIMALVMIFLGVTILAINQKITGSRKAYTTVTGKSSNVSLISLKKGRNIVTAIVFIFIIIVSVLPLISFAIESLIVVPGRYSLSNMSLQFWIGEGSTTIANSEPGILRNKNIYTGLWNSIKLAVSVSLLAGTVGFLAGYAIVRGKNSRLAKAVDNLAFFPYLIPSMAFSAIYLSMFSVRRGVIPPLYGTFALLVLIGTVKYLPFASRSSINSMHQLSPEIEEAGEIMGIGWFKRIRKIVIPIQKSSFISGYLLPFISGMRELSLFILLVTPSTKMLTTMLFQYNEKGWSQYANAINLIIVLIVIASNLIVNKLTGASIDKGIGGVALMPNILLKNISKRFSSDSLAVDNVTLEIKDGDFITLLGPSGCGKTTLLRMIAGLETPTEGEIYIDDELVFSSEKGVDLSPDKRNVGFLFQNYALWPNMTVFQNIAFGLENLKWDKEKIKDRVGELLELMQISDLGDRYPAELSGGQQQRVAIARTLATNPPTLLMDEPLSNLDAKLRTEMRTELKRLHLETGSTFVYVTHDQLEAMTLSTKICLVKRGVLQQYSPPLELYRSPINTFVADFVGNPNMNLLPMKATQEGDKITLHHQEVSLTFKVDEGTPKLEKDHPCILGLRPEKVIITENGTLKASVYSSLPSGMETIVSVKIGDLTITAVVFGTVDYAVGEEVGVDFSSAEYLLFDANTTEQVAMGTLEILSK